MKKYIRTTVLIILLFGISPIICGKKNCGKKIALKNICISQQKINAQKSCSYVISGKQNLQFCQSFYLPSINLWPFFAMPALWVYCRTAAILFRQNNPTKYYSGTENYPILTF